ncbi:glycerate kinase [Staphylococcus canis]|uniref:Glycerate kinase n=1 Tax=Staphylococcus canis TaxID=2724942 RepID=A0ABS0T6J4_9STAP|nr:glycerate kinase [Staphylococcus canis]MBI5974366.1 glycerate kinase [Staphylococcus canis]
MKHIVIAPDSFKESMTAMEAATAIEKGWYRVFGDTVTYTKLPMADGGEGTFRALHDALLGNIHTHIVTGPLGDPVHAQYSFVEESQTAIIEMAEASGLHLISLESRNPLRTTTYGTGELVKHVLDRGAKHIILGIGGSATNDGGIGFLQALGAQILDKDGRAIPYGGQYLKDIVSIDFSTLDTRLEAISIEVACDVENPLIGLNGATHVYGPQKGATPEMIDVLEAGMVHYHTVLAHTIGRNLAHIPGSGAAGGLGTALLVFPHVVLKRGIEIVLEKTRFNYYVQSSDLVITGEGSIDGQTIYGKTPIGVAKAAKVYQKPVIAIAGVLREGFEQVEAHGIDAVFSVSKGPTTLKEALKDGKVDLERLAYQIAKFYKVTK